MSVPPSRLALNLVVASAAAAALVGLAAGQCDPPDYISSINVTCPSEEEAPDTSVTFADPDHCSEYYECYNGCSTHLICEDDFLYDEVNGWCNTPEDVSCGDRDCDGLPCSSDPTLATADPDEYDCEEDGTYPYEDNCIKYVLCTGGTAYVEICPVADDGQQEYWCTDCDDGNGWCDFPENVSCEGRPVCDEYDENCKDQTTTAPNLCDTVPCGSDDELVELGGCEECYCQCSGGVPYTICCDAESGLYYNPEVESCDWDYNNPAC